VHVTSQLALSSQSTKQSAALVQSIFVHVTPGWQSIRHCGEPVQSSSPQVVSVTHVMSQIVPRQSRTSQPSGQNAGSAGVHTVGLEPPPQAATVIKTTTPRIVSMIS
jgi:hypothetical protein